MMALGHRRIDHGYSLRSLHYIPLSKITQIQKFQNSLPKNKHQAVEAKFHMQPPWDVGNENCSNVLSHMTKMASRPNEKNLQKSPTSEPSG